MKKEIGYPKARLGCKDIMPFGKFKGWVGANIARTQPSYIMWLDSEASNVKVSKKLRRLAASIGILQSEERACRLDEALFGAWWEV